MDISLFRSIASQYQNLRTVSTVATMNAISHQIEDQVIQQSLPIDFYAGFQKFSHFPDQLRRYSRLGAVCRRVYVFGVPDVQPPSISGIEFIPITPASALSEEWFVVVNTPHFWTTLLTQEVDGRDSITGGRRFDGVWSYDQQVVERATLLVSQVLGKEYQPLYERNYEQQHTAIAAISNRMVSDLEGAQHVGHRRWARLCTMHRLGEAMTKSYGIPRINDYPFHMIQEVVQILHTIFGADDAVIALRDRGEQYTVVATAGTINTNGHPLKVNDGPSGRALRDGVVMHIDDVQKSHERDSLLPGSPTLIAAPIVGRQRVYGVIAIGGNVPHQWDVEDTQTLQVVANFLALAIENGAEANGTNASQRERLKRLEHALVGLRRPIGQLLEIHNKLSQDHGLALHQQDLVAQMETLTARMAQMLGVSANGSSTKPEELVPHRELNGS